MVSEDDFFTKPHQLGCCEKTFTYADLKLHRIKGDQWYEPSMCKGCDAKACDCTFALSIDQEHLSEKNWNRIKKYYKDKNREIKNRKNTKLEV